MKRSQTSEGTSAVERLSSSTLKCLASSDIMYHIQGFLQPRDILALRKTSSYLTALTRHRNVWLQAARNTCHDEGIPVPWFPIERMTVLELEHLALSPGRFLKFMKSTTNSSLTRPGRVQTLFPMNPFEAGEPLMIRKMVLLPGGRFLLTESVTGICLWDLGYNASQPAKCHPIAHRWIVSQFSMRHPRPTADGKGFLVLCCLKSSVPSIDCLELYEIYPHIENPTFVLRADVHIPTPDCVYFFGKYVVFASPDYEYDAENLLDINVWDWAKSTGCRWKGRDAEGISLFGTTVIFDLDDNGKMDVHTLPHMKPLVEGLKWDISPEKNSRKLIFNRQHSSRSCYAIGQTFSWLKSENQFLCIWDGDDFDEESEESDNFEGSLSFEIHHMNPTLKGPISHIPTYRGVSRDFTGPKEKVGLNLPRMSGNGLHWLGQAHIFVQTHLHLDSRHRFAFTAIPVQDPSSDDSTTGTHTLFYTPAHERTDPDLVGFCPFAGRVVTYVPGDEVVDEDVEQREPEIRIADFLLPSSCVR